MKYILTLSVVFSWFASTSQISSSQQNRVDQIFSEFVDKDSPGVAIGIISNGELVYSTGYGNANLDYSIPLAPDSKFYIASIAKQFTAACVALLSIQGQLNLTDDIRTYFPELPDYDKEITIENLIYHTSGLRDYLSLKYLKGESFEDYFNNTQGISLISKQHGLNFQPNEEYLYSNSNYILLAELVKRVTGVTIREYAFKNIFEPLGMNNTFFNDNSAQVTKNRVVSYRKDDNGLYQRYVQNFDGHGDGGMISTINDLFKWDQNFYHKKVGGSAFIDLMLKRKNLNNGYLSTYAFGLEHGMYMGLPIVVHGGNFLGFNHHFTRFPNQKFSVIVLANYVEVDPYFITDKISDIFLEKEYNLPVPMKKISSDPIINIPSDKTNIKRFVGDYWNFTDNFSRKIYIRNDTLRFSRGINNESSLIPISNNEFKMLVASDVIVSFKTNTAGKMHMNVNINNQSSYNFKAYHPSKYNKEDLAQFTGSYYSAELDCLYEFRVDGTKLNLYINNENKSSLDPIMSNLFISDFAGTIIFTEEDHNEFVVNSNRVRGIIFNKKQ